MSVLKSLALAAFALILAAPAAAAPTITVGSQTLSLCDTRFNGYCGRIKRPLDPTGHIPGKIGIGFIYFPARARPADPEGVIVATEGGPGYASTGSRVGYLNLFVSLRARRAMLIVDNRGTGRSENIDCPDLQAGQAGPAAVAACAAKLGPAAGLYGTALATDDMAAVFDALAIKRVDLYGDSYGTYFGQVFAVRHGDRLRTLVLDSAYKVNGGSSFGGGEWAHAVKGVADACDRSPSCPGGGAQALRRLWDLVAEMRANPVHGAAPNESGVLVETKADIARLMTFWGNGAYIPPVYREFDAAARAHAQGDDRPLLRLMAETGSATYLGGSHGYSAGLAQAVTCTDYPVLYDLSAGPAERRVQVDAAVARARARTPDLFAPFTFDEGVKYFAESPYGCLPWPDPPPGYVQGMPFRKHAHFPDTPTLVLSGEFDTSTPEGGARAAAAQFPNATFVEVPNGIHEVAITTGGFHPTPVGSDVTGCVSAIVTAFVASGGQADTSCAPRIRPYRTVPAFVRSAKDALAPTAVAGNGAGPRALAYASAAAETAGDVLARYTIALGDQGAGLRGGRFAFTQTAKGYDFTLDRVKWTEDLAVGGTIHWDQTTGRIVADLAFKTPDGGDGHVRVAWNDRETNAVATIVGVVDGKAVASERVAP